MLSSNDLQQIKLKGISQENIDWQLNIFKNGVPYYPLSRTANIGDGILKLTDQEIHELKNFYESSTISALKFVPASGAASRMFKDLYEFLEALSKGENTDNYSVQLYQDNISKYAFFNQLKQKAEQTRGENLKFPDDWSLPELIELLLNDKGLGYGKLPKGLLKFHQYNNESRTPFEEHMVEAALYTSFPNQSLQIHFTVSPEHQLGFEKLLTVCKPILETRFNKSFNISFSAQLSATDTIAVDSNNQPFRNDDGSILFRPGGHGALLDNLNSLDADIIFIKNIDNVIPERLLQPTVDYKKALAGKLLEIQKLIFNWINKLSSPEPIDGSALVEIEKFIKKTLCYEYANSKNNTKNVSNEFLFSILDRPIRVCGVVKNQGEPGGGPFWGPNSKGDISLQIVESSQIDINNPIQKTIFSAATHFNPVDLVCSPRRFNGTKFDLSKFIDQKTCFISSKSKDGKVLKALELPGLWNGSMADWITLFVEVPIETFNPVKTVNDLLRPQHQ